jgi:hypothetical protein
VLTTWLELDGKMIMNNEKIKIWKTVIMDYL